MSSEKVCTLITIIIDCFKNDNYHKLEVIGLHLDVLLFERQDNRDILFTLFNSIVEDENINILSLNAYTTNYDDVDKIFKE